MPDIKLMIYPKSCGGKPIIITDKNSKESLSDLENRLQSILKSNNIFCLNTDDDMILGRPSEIAFFHISSPGQFKVVEPIKKEIQISEVKEVVNDIVDPIEVSDTISNESETPVIPTNYDDIVII